MLTIAFDMDGPLADWDHGFREAMKVHTPHIPIVQYEDRVHFYAVDDYPEEHRDLLRELPYRPGFYRDLPPVPGAAAFLNQLAKRANVILLTAQMSKHLTGAQEKSAWVREHLGAVWQDRLYVGRDKTHMMADVLVDDKPGITGLYVPTWEHVLMDAPYNRHYTAARRATWETMGTVLSFAPTRPPRAGTLA